MIYVLIGLSALFIAIGFLVNEQNAKYLLAGYNTMTEAERKVINLKNYIAYFKKFHLFLGVSFLILGLILYSVHENAAGIFLAVYPVLGYIYFIATSAKFSGGLKTKSNKLGLILLSLALVVVLGILGYGFKENKMRISTQEIEITGIYGEVLGLDKINQIDTMVHLPKITLKTNGFALGKVRKGYFKTESGKTVKLILNSDQLPYLVITKSNQEVLYFSAKSSSNSDLYAQILAARN